MKPLQNNFTTPEQSKRLLELGVPADSADLVYFNDFRKIGIDIIPQESSYKEYTEGRVVVAPCWSVGQLIEIYELCYAQAFIRDVGVCLMEDVLNAICNAINDTTAQWDFSKLED